MQRRPTECVAGRARPAGAVPPRLPLTSCAARARADAAFAAASWRAVPRPLQASCPAKPASASCAAPVALRARMFLLFVQAACSAAPDAPFLRVARAAALRAADALASGSRRCRATRQTRTRTLEAVLAEAGMRARARETEASAFAAASVRRTTSSCAGAWPAAARAGAQNRGGRFLRTLGLPGVPSSPSGANAAPPGWC